MVDQTVAYFSVHPAQLSAVGLTAVLAAVGLWYVLAHHLQAILITILCALGTGSGMLVFYRGFNSEMRDLMWIGVFLVAVFPIIYWQAIKQLEPMPEPRGGRAKALFSRKLR